MNLIRNLGFKEIMIIVLLLIVFFGSKRITSLAKKAGESTKELKKAKKEYDDAMVEISKSVEEESEEKND